MKLSLRRCARSRDADERVRRDACVRPDRDDRQSRRQGRGPAGRRPAWRDRCGASIRRPAPVQAVTDIDGRYTILNVRVGGPYKVTVTMSGFKKSR